MIYWDTSCVLKLYTAERDSGAWQDLALATPGEFVSSALLETELAFALLRKEQGGAVKANGAEALMRIFRSDVKDGRFVLYPIGRDVLAGATALASACGRMRPPIPLRTLDGLHLATARLLACKAVATADVRMAAAAVALRMRVLAPH